MYARFSTFNAAPANLDAAIAYCREDGMTAMQHIDGFVGLSMLVARSTGHCIVTSAWKDEMAMRLGAREVAPIRTRMGELLDAQAQIDEYEIALMHRSHRAPSAAYVRGTWLRCDPSRLDDLVATFRMTTLARLEEFAGFCNATVFAQRESGRCCVSITYDSRAALDAVRDQADALRKTTMAAMDAEVEHVAEYDLVVARFHVPELV